MWICRASLRFHRNISNHQKPYSVISTNTSRSFSTNNTEQPCNSYPKTQEPQITVQENRRSRNQIHDQDEVRKITQEMKDGGFVSLAAAMLRRLCENGNAHEVMRILEQMRCSRSLPPVAVHTAAVAAFCRTMELGKAKCAIENMKAEGVVPNSYTYSYLLLALCHDRDGACLDDVVKYSTEMLDMGLKPGMYTTVTVVDALCKQQRFRDVKAFIRLMKDNGFAHSTFHVTKFLQTKGPFSPSVWRSFSVDPDRPVVFMEGVHQFQASSE